MPKRSGAPESVWEFQTIPSVVVVTVPAKPTATDALFPPATLTSALEVPELRELQLTPSLDVRMVPCAPTATYWPDQYATLDRSLTEPDARGIQLAPSGDVAIAPEGPTRSEERRVGKEGRSRWS